MMISCICPTYGRPPKYQHLLEEAIDSFLRQDYADKELIVFNDAPNQTLYCDSPGVRVLNAPGRVASLGQKYNLAIEAAYGDLICPWEDDDISLPWRLGLSAELLGDDDYYNPQRYWFLQGNCLISDHPQGYSHNCSMYRKSAWTAVGGYAEVSGPQDAIMDGQLRAKCQVAAHEPLSIDQWFYIYRWGVQPWHLSSRGGESNEFYDEIGQYELPGGHFFLEPHWRRDYEEETRRAIATHKSAAV